jgi:hypothetical protein
VHSVVESNKEVTPQKSFCIKAAQVTRHQAVMGEISPELARTALVDVADFPLQHHPHDLLSPRGLSCGTTSSPMTPPILRPQRC